MKCNCNNFEIIDIEWTGHPYMADGTHKNVKECVSCKKISWEDLNDTMPIDIVAYYIGDTPLVPLSIKE